MDLAGKEDAPQRRRENKETMKLRKTEEGDQQWERE
jgi:hypothetical protein